MCSMKCTIPGVSLKVFGRAIQSLSKIGDELYFEPLEDGLYLRSVNSCRSAYACFQFSPSFFLHYVDGRSDDRGASDDEPLRCKIGMRSVMTVFKSLSTIDKTVEKCRISLNMTDARLVFQMYCRHGIIKTHNLAFIECETLQAVFSKDMCPNKLTAIPKLLCDAVLNFQNNQEEITLIVRPDFMALKNYVDDEPDPNKVVHTELTLSPDEFDQYQVGVDTDVTFCLKELRAILAFADITCLPVTLQFETAGRPITFSIDSDLSFEANFVLATLADVESSQPPPVGLQGETRQTTSTSKTQRRKNAARENSVQNGKSSSNRNSSQTDQPGKTHSRNPETSASQPVRPPHRPAPQRDTAGPSTAPDYDAMDDNDDDELSMAMMDVSVPEDTLPHTAGSQIPSHHQLGNALSDKHGSTSAPQNGGGDNFHDNDENQEQEDDDDDGWGRGVEAASNFLNQLPALAFSDGDNSKQRDRNESRLRQEQENNNNNPTSTTSHSSESGNNSHDAPEKGRLLSLKSASARESDTSPVIPMQDPDMANKSIPDEAQDDEDDDEEIPATPPSKKFRSVFFGTQSSTQPTQSQQNTVILAPDSDDD